MLEIDDPQQVEAMLAEVPCRVELPALLHGSYPRHGTPSEPHEERRFTRYGCPAKTMMVVLKPLPSVPKSSEPCCVLTKDISRTGIAFLHAEQLFPGEQVVLWLPTGIMPCTIVRCTRHGAHCYEIGAVFGTEAPEPAASQRS